MTDSFAKPQLSMVDSHVKQISLSQYARIQRLLLTFLQSSRRILSLPGQLVKGIKDMLALATVIRSRFFAS